MPIVACCFVSPGCRLTAGELCGRLSICTLFGFRLFPAAATSRATNDVWMTPGERLVNRRVFVFLANKTRREKGGEMCESKQDPDESEIAAQGV